MKIDQVAPDTEVEQLDNSELVMLHAALHSYWVEFENGRGVEGWEKNDVIETHGEVRSQLKERGLPHQSLNDLDDATNQRSLEPEWEVVGQNPRDEILRKLKNKSSVAQSDFYSDLDFGRREIRQELETLEEGEIIESIDVSPKCWYMAQNKQPKQEDITEPTQEDIEALAERITAEADSTVSRWEMR